MIDVSEVVNDPDVSENFVILRSTGQWTNGIWQANEPQQGIQSYGPIRPASARDLKMIPQGDHVGEVKAFWSAQPIYGTHGTGANGGSSDILIWKNLQYRVLHVFQSQEWGFYKALADRLKAN